MPQKLIATITWFFCSLALAEEHDLIINNVTIVSAERPFPLSGANVAINNGVITEVSIKPIASDSKTLINGQGLFLTPGLMDSHVHLGSMPGISQRPQDAREMIGLQQTFMANQPKAYLYYGVTQLLDLNMTAEGLRGFTRHAIRPDVAFCGAIGVLDGYGTAGIPFQQVKATRPYILLDESLQNRVPEGVDWQKHSAPYLVEQIAKDGAACIKIFLEDGFGRASHWTILSERLVQQVRQEAKKYALPVFAHANAIDMQMLAVEYQVDGITHGMWNWNELDGQPGLPSEISAIVDDIHRQGMIFQPTFNVMDGLVGVLSDEVLNDNRYRKVVPDALIQWYKTEPGKWFRREFIAGFDGLSAAQIAGRFNTMIEQNERVVKKLAELAHPLVLASDTPSSPTYAAQPGYSTYLELLHMFHAGVGLADIFAAATINNAKAFGLTEQYGTIEPGKKASLLLLRKNPLKDITAYDAIETVILRGQVIQRDALLAND